MTDEYVCDQGMTPSHRVYWRLVLLGAVTLVVTAWLLFKGRAEGDEYGDLYASHICSDGRKVAIIECSIETPARDGNPPVLGGTLRCWTSATHASSRIGALQGYDVGGWMVPMDFFPGDDRVWVLHKVVDYATQDREGRPECHRILTIGDVDALKIVKQFTIPAGPPVACLLESNRIVTPCSMEPDLDMLVPMRLGVFDVGGDNVKPLRTIDFHGRFFIGSVQRLTHDIVLVHVTRLSKSQSAIRSSSDRPRGGPTELSVDVGPPPGPGPDKSPSPPRLISKSSELLTCDTKTGRILVRQATEASGLFDCIRVAKDGKHLAVAGTSSVELRSLPSLAVSGTISLSHDAWKIAISPDGRYVALASTALGVWNTATGEVQMFDASQGKSKRYRQRHVAKSPDFSRDYFHAFRDYAAALTFIGDGSKLAMTTVDGVFSLWNVATGECIRSEEVPIGESGSGQAVGIRQ
jgi:hypothetical protein